MLDLTTWEDIDVDVLEAAERLGERLYVLIENTHDPHGKRDELERLWIARVEPKPVADGVLTYDDLKDLSGTVSPGMVKPDMSARPKVLRAFQPLCGYYQRGVRFRRHEGPPWDAWGNKNGGWWDGIPLRFRSFHFRFHHDRKLAHPVNLPVVYDDRGAAQRPHGLSTLDVMEIIDLC